VKFLGSPKRSDIIKHISKIVPFLILGLFLLPSPVFAATRTWDGEGGDNNWSTPQNWSANKMPKSSDNAVFNATSVDDSVIDQALTVKNLTIENGYTGTISATGNLSVSQDYEQEVGTGVTFSPSSTNVSIGRDLILSGGTFSGGSGTIDVDRKFTLSGASFTSSSGTMFCGGDFTFSSGSFTHNSGTIEFDTSSFTITPGTATFNNITFNDTKTFSIAADLTVNGTLALTDGAVNDNTINAKGNITLASTFDGGTTSLVVDGTGSQTLTGGGSAAAGDFLPLTISKDSGTLVLANTMRTGRNWTYTKGTVNVGTSTVVFADADLNITGDFTFNNLTFDSNDTFTITGGTTITTAGTLALTDGEINTGTVNGENGVTVGASFLGGNAILELTVAGDQAITGAGGTAPDTVNINKTSDIVTVSGDTTFESINLQDGTLTFQGGSTYTINTSLTTSSGTLLNLQGTSGNLITLRKLGGGTWLLNVNTNGTVTTDFVDVTRSDASGGQVIYATNSTDSNFNTNWVFGDKLVFVTVAQTLDQDEISGPITIEIQSTDGTAQVAGSENITIDLSTTSGGGELSANADPFVSITSIDILANADPAQATFYYRDSVVGNPVITATENPDRSWTDATQIEIINPATAYFTVDVTTPQIAGQAFTLTITARKLNGDVSTSYTGTANLTVNYVSPNTGILSIEPASTSNFVNGIATISATYNDCGTITITATDTVDPTIAGTSSITAFFPSSLLVVISNTDTITNHTVNKPFTLTITGRSVFGATCPNYKGPTNLTINYVSPSANQLGSLSTSSLTSDNWVSGVATITNQTYNKWGTVSIIATDATLTTQTGTSSNITFVPKDFSIELSNPPASRTFYYTDEEFSATITARDNDDNAVTNYQGTISFRDSDLNLPEDYTFTATDAGIHQFSGINGEDEAITDFSVQDSTYTTVTGTSETITIKEGIIKVNSASGPVGSVGTTVEILDSNGNILTEDDSTTFTIVINEVIDNSSASSSTVSSPVTVTNGVGEISITNNEGEAVTVTPISSPILNPISGTITFGTVSGTGVGVQLWREIRTPEEYEQEK